MARDDHAMPTTMQARSELSTTRLIEAAADLIAEQGYDRTTLMAIAKRAGYTHGLVTARFGSKEGLLWAVVERMVVDWQEALLNPSIGAKTGPEAVHAMLSEVRTSWRKSPKRMRALYTLMFEALLPIPTLNERMAQLHRDLRRSAQKAVQDGIADGSVRRDTDAAAVARLVVGGLRGAVYQHMLDPRSVPIDRALGELTALVDALLPPGSES